MEPKLTSYEKSIAIIISIAMTLSTIGVICSFISFNKSMLYFSILNFFGWLIMGILLIIFNIKVFKK